ncbi:MAG: ATPase, T2SS/T4P/T4SS family [Vulcanimicrobiaceae bacterium]
MSSPIFVFIGSKGGVGTTTICYELAKLLRGSGNVAIVDGDLGGRRSFAILTNGVRNLDAARESSAIATARVDGITIAELANRYDAAFTINRDAVEQLTSSLNGYDAVLVDAPQPFAAAVRPFIVRATRFFIVLEPTLLGVAGAKSSLNDLERFGIPQSRTDVIVNTRSSGDAIARSEIESLLGMRLVAEIPAMGERNYAKSLSSLQRHLESIVPEETLEGLQPSTKAPIGDRRGETRRTYIPPANGQPAVPEIRSTGTVDAERDAIKLEIHAALLREVDLVAASLAHTDATKLAELRVKIEGITSQYIAQRQFSGSAEDIARLRQEVINEALGLGPLEDLMHDPDVTEIMVNGPDAVYIERNGRIERTAKRFTADQQLRLVIERIIAPLGRRIDESSPMVDARLPDGSRVNAIIEPLALDGATLTIRRFGQKRLQDDDLVRLGAVTPPVMEFLRAAVEARLNCVISGGTGSGKTTFLNVLSGFLPDRERIITIEDAAELYLNQTHVVRLESRPANIEGTGEIRIRDLLRNSLRMRPDRIIIGECRGAEALDMLQAMNTGHDGSLTTIHANSPRDALSRIETMVLMAGFDLPVRAIREQISNALDVVIHTARLRDGTRKVVSISEVVGMEGEIVTMQELVRFAQQGVDKENKVIGEFQYTGVQPNCLKRFQEYGVSYDPRGLATMASAGALW